MSAMEKFAAFAEKNLVPVASKLAANRYLGAVRDGFTNIMPIVILGAMWLMLVSLPVRDPNLPTYWKAYDELMIAHRGWLLQPYWVSMNLMGLYFAFTIGYNLSKSYNLSAVTGGLLSLFAFLMTSAPITYLAAGDAGDAIVGLAAGEGSQVIISNYLDAKGLFTGIIIGIVAVEIYRFMVTKKLTIKMPDSVPPAVLKSFEALYPIFAIMLVTLPINHILLGTSTPMILPEKILALFGPLVSASNSLPAILLVVFLIHALWWFGIHGANATLGIVAPILAVNFANNQAILNGTAAAGATPAVFANGFMDFFVYMGGSGATLGLVFLMLFSKSQQLKQVAKVSIGPSIFQINEPVLFGTPFVMNPIMGIPFILAPMINATIAYFVLKSGAAGMIAGTAPWTTPAPLAALFSTNFNVTALILSVALTVLSAMIYFPFFKVYDAQLSKAEKLQQAA